MPKEDELSERPERGEEKAQLEEAAEAALKMYSSSERAQLRDTVNTARNMQEDVDLKMFHSPALDLSWTKLVTNSLEDVEKERGGEQYIVNLEKQTQVLLTYSNSADGHQFNVLRYMAGVLGLNVPPETAAATFELMSRFASGKDADHVPATGGLQSDVRDVVLRLAREDDKFFWDRVYRYATSNVLTCVDLIYFMQYTEQLFPLNQAFIWRSSQDKGDLIYKLVCAGSRTADPSVMGVLVELRGVLALEGNPPLRVPRAVAANCAALAFAALATGQTSPSGL